MKKKKLPQEPIAEEWDFSEGFGIMPTDIPLSQNIGCVGVKPKKQGVSPVKSENKE